MELGKRARSSDRRTANSREVIAVAVRNALDEPEGSQTVELTGELRAADLRDERREIGAAHPVDVELWALQCAQKPLLGALEEVRSLDRSLAVLLRLARSNEMALAAGGVLDSGQKFQVTSVASEQNLAQIDQAVDALLQWGKLPSAVTIPVFHLAVVLEKGNIVGGRLQAQHAAELVVRLYPDLAEAVLDAGALDADGKAAADLLRKQRGDLLAQEACDLLGFDREHRLTRELLVQGFEAGLGTKYQIGGVLQLHQAPVIAQSEHIEYRAALAGIAIQNPVQGIRLQGIGERLRPRPVLDTDKGVVEHGEVDTFGGQLLRQPRMPVAVELQPEWAVGVPVRLSSRKIVKIGPFGQGWHTSSLCKFAKKGVINTNSCASTGNAKLAMLSLTARRNP